MHCVWVFLHLFWMVHSCASPIIFRNFINQHLMTVNLEKKSLIWLTFAGPIPLSCFVLWELIFFTCSGLIRTTGRRHTMEKWKELWFIYCDKKEPNENLRKSKNIKVRYASLIRNLSFVEQPFAIAKSYQLRLWKII